MWRTKREETEIIAIRAPHTEVRGANLQNIQNTFHESNCKVEEPPGALVSLPRGAIGPVHAPTASSRNERATRSIAADVSVDVCRCDSHTLYLSLGPEVSTQQPGHFLYQGLLLLVTRRVQITESLKRL